MATIAMLIQKEYEYHREFDKWRIGESGLTVNDLPRIIDSLQKCGSGKVDRVNIATGNRKVLFHAKCNKSKLCRDCADAEYMTRLKSVEKWYKQNVESVSCCYFVTFTQEKRIEESARDASRRMLDSWRAFQRIGQKNRGKEYSKMIAGFRSLEIEPTIENGRHAGFHAHIHALVFTSSRLDYRVYDQEVRSMVREKYGFLPNKEWKEKMKLHGGILDEISSSELSREWGASGAGNRGAKAELIFEKKTATDCMFGKMKGNKELEKRVRYALKYSMKDNDFSGLESGRLFEILDAMTGLRKNQYIGGVGKFEEEKQDDDDAFDCDNHIYGVTYAEKTTENCIEEKIIREVFPAEKTQAEQDKRDSIQFYRANRKLAFAEYKKHLDWYRRNNNIFTKKIASDFDVGLPEHIAYISDYISAVDNGYNFMKYEIKMIRNRIENKARTIMKFMDSPETVWKNMPKVAVSVLN